MVLVLRDWRDDDVDWWVDLRTRWYPAMTPEQLRRLASGAVRPWLRRIVAEEDGARVGFASVLAPADEGPSTTLAIVEPPARGRGIGRSLTSRIFDEFGSRELLAAMPDADPRAFAVAQHWGFRTRSHSIEFVLDVSRGVGSPRHVEDVVVRIVEDADVGTSGVDLDRLLLASSTHPEASLFGWVMDRAEYSRMFASLVWVVAEVDGVAAALTCADRQDGVEWVVVFTGVDPAYRGRGLARLVKEHLHLLASVEGAERLCTDNEERNTTIRALNQELGFVAVGGEYRLIRPADAAGLHRSA